MKRWALIIIILLSVFGLWLYFGISKVVQAEKDVVAKFDELAGYYALMNDDYLKPVKAIPELPEGDRKSLTDIESNLDKLQPGISRDEQFEALRSGQKQMLEFLGNASLPEQVTLNPRFQAWNKNATNFGEASSYLKSYNDALGAYNAIMVSSAGKLVGHWRSWSHRKYLRIDGELESTPQVSF